MSKCSFSPFPPSENHRFLEPSSLLPGQNTGLFAASSELLPPKWSFSAPNVITLPLRSNHLGRKNAVGISKFTVRKSEKRGKKADFRTKIGGAVSLEKVQISRFAYSKQQKSHLLRLFFRAISARFVLPKFSLFFTFLLSFCQHSLSFLPLPPQPLPKSRPAAARCLMPPLPFCPCSHGKAPPPLPLFAEISLHNHDFCEKTTDFQPLRTKEALQIQGKNIHLPILR